MSNNISQYYSFNRISDQINAEYQKTLLKTYWPQNLNSSVHFWFCDGGSVKNQERVY